MNAEKPSQTLNIQGFIKNDKRQCDRYSCNHQLDEHSRTDGKCTECNCKEILLRRDRISINTGTKEYPCSHVFNNCMVRICPNCETETTMKGYKTEKFQTQFDMEIKMAIHICDECSVITYYEVDHMFESYLRDKRYRFEDFFVPKYF